MTYQNSKFFLHAAVGLLLTVPTAFFILISILKFSFGVSFFYDSVEPALVLLGLKESLGFNINLLLLFGPIAAFLLNTNSVLSIHSNLSNEEMNLQIRLKRSTINWTVIIVSGLCLAALTVYFLGEALNY